MSTPRRIHSKGLWRHEEATVGEAGIYPGMFIEINSSGNMIKHATEGGGGERSFAIEDALQGDTVATVFANGDDGKPYGVFYIGSQANVLVQAGENISIGDKLVSAGNGKLIKDSSVSSGVTSPQTIAIAQEALDISDSTDVDTLCRAQIVSEK